MIQKKEGEGLGWEGGDFCCIRYHISGVMELDFVWQLTLVLACPDRRKGENKREGGGLTLIVTVKTP